MKIIIIMILIITIIILKSTLNSLGIMLMYLVGKPYQLNDKVLKYKKYDLVIRFYL